jgi:tetratricopeptide (TPR) repeat protein
LRCRDATLAQLVEQLTCNQQVAGSSPAGGSWSGWERSVSSVALSAGNRRNCVLLRIESGCKSTVSSPPSNDTIVVGTQMFEFNDAEWSSLRSEFDAEELLRQCVRAHTQGSLQAIEGGLCLPEQLEHLTSYCLERERFQEALAVASLWTMLAPYSAEAWDKLGVAYSGVRSHRQAVEAFEKALACNPNDVEIILHLAAAYSDAGIVSEAEAYLNYALLLDPSCEDAIWQKAVFAQRRGYYRDAIELYERLADSPHYAREALFELGFCYDCCQRFDDACIAYERAIELDPYNADAWLNRGIVLARAGRYAEAIESYDYALAISPAHVGALYNKANLLSLVGRLEAAIECYREALSHDRSDPAIWLNLGSTLGELGRYHEAIEAFTEAIARAPEYFEAYFGRGTCYDALGNPGAALVDYDTALRFQSAYAELWYARAEALVKLGINQEAIQSYETALKLDPQNASCWYDYAMVLATLRRYTEATEALHRATMVAPQWADPYFALVKVYLLCGNVAAARDALQSAIALDPLRKDAFEAELLALLPEQSILHLRSPKSP